MSINCVSIEKKQSRKKVKVIAPLLTGVLRHSNDKIDTRGMKKVPRPKKSGDMNLNLLVE